MTYYAERAIAGWTLVAVIIFAAIAAFIRTIFKK